MAEKKEHDYRGPIEKTTVELARTVVSELNSNFEDLIFNMVEASEEDLKKKEEKAVDFGIHIMKIMAATDIPADYATHCIERIGAFLQSLQQYIDGSLRQNNDEIMSRFLGVKSHEGKYRKELATVGDIVRKLDEVRQATGGKNEEYFNDAIADEAKK